MPYRWLWGIWLILELYLAIYLALLLLLLAYYYNCSIIQESQDGQYVRSHNSSRFSSLKKNRGFWQFSTSQTWDSTDAVGLESKFLSWQTPKSQVRPFQWNFFSFFPFFSIFPWTGEPNFFHGWCPNFIAFSCVTFRELHLFDWGLWLISITRDQKSI